MRFNYTVRDDNKILQSDDNHAFFKNCVRFSKHKMKELTDREIANVYVHLRKRGTLPQKLFQYKIGCDRATAIQYCVQPHCKVDITASKLGPSRCKELKAEIDPINLYYGWQIAGRVNYKLDEAHSNYREISSDRDELGLNKFFFEEKHLNAEYREKMKHLKEFYIQLNQKYNYSEMPFKELYLKLKEMEEEAIRKDNQPKSFLKGKGVKFFEIVDIVNQEDETSIKGNRIVDLKAFRSLLSENEKDQFQLKQKFINRAYNNNNQENEIQEQVDRRNSVLKQLSKKYFQEANSSVRDLHESAIQAHELYKEEYNQSRYVTITPRKSKDNHIKDLLRANTVHLKKNKIKTADFYEDTIPEIEQEDDFNTLKKPFGHIYDHSSGSRDKLGCSFNVSDYSNEAEKKRHKKIQFIRAAQLQQQRSAIKLEKSTDLNQGYLEFEKKLDDLAHDELQKILHPLRKGPRKIKPPQPIKRFSVFHQQSFDDEIKPIVRSQLINTSLNQLVQRVDKEKQKLTDSAFGEPRERSFSVKKKYRIKITRTKTKKMALMKQKTILDENVGDDNEDNPDRETPNLFKRVLKNYPDDQNRANKILQQLLNRKKRQKDLKQNMQAAQPVQTEENQ